MKVISKTTFTIYSKLLFTKPTTYSCIQL